MMADGPHLPGSATLRTAGRLGTTLGVSVDGRIQSRPQCRAVWRVLPSTPDFAREPVRRCWLPVQRSSPDQSAPDGLSASRIRAPLAAGEVGHALAMWEHERRDPVRSTALQALRDRPERPGFEPKRPPSVVFRGVTGACAPTSAGGMQGSDHARELSPRPRGEAQYRVAIGSHASSAARERPPFQITESRRDASASPAASK